MNLLSLAAGVPLMAGTAAAADFRYAEPTVPAGPSMAALLLRMGVALTLVVGLIYLTGWFLRRAQPGISRLRGSGGRAPAPVQVESHVALGPKRSLYSVRWGKFRLLLGAGSSEISLLASDWDGQDGPAQEDHAALPSEAQFERHLDDFLSRLGRMEDDPSL